MVNRPFAPEFCFHWHDGNAIGLHPAIAAAFADICVDEDALVWIREQPPFAAASFFSSAGLNVDNRADAFVLGVSLLHGLIGRAFMGFDPFELRQVNVFFFVIDHCDIGDAHGLQFIHDALGA